ncbi:MAG: hypothetical protein V8R91_04425 [Butyricimonas faecihominis]
MGFANLMTEDGLPAEEKKVFSDTITSNSRALLGLLDDVLDFLDWKLGWIRCFSVFAICISWYIPWWMWGI